MNKYESQNPEDEGIRFTPNLNVFIELGYAATVVGWENIICLFDKVKKRKDYDRESL